MSDRGAKLPAAHQPEQDGEEIVIHSLRGLFDADWYAERYPDIIAVGIEPIRHFIRHGLEEKRDPNAFFESAWYLEHYPDVGASGFHPLLHYVMIGATEGRNPHPRFDAAWYVQEHPEAASNPVVFHLGVGRARGYLTEKPIDIQTYLPTRAAAPAAPQRVFVDVVIPVYRGLEETQRCLEAVLADPDRPMGRIIVIDDCSPEPALSAWLQELGNDGRIYLILNPRNAGFVVSANRGMEAAGDHDVVLLNSDTEVPAGWLRRLMAQAYAHPRIASTSPLSNNATICSWPHNQGSPIPFGQTLQGLDAICRSVNAGRYVETPTTVGFCMYIRRQALREVGLFDADHFGLGYGEENDFCLRASSLGWHHRIACDIFVYHAGAVSFSDRATKLMRRAMQRLRTRFPSYERMVAAHVFLDAIAPARFAVTASVFRQSGLPVILLVSHHLGGGIKRHIEHLVTRFAGQAHFLLLGGTHRGATLSVPALPGHPELTLPAYRIDDLVTLLQSFAVSRVHIHHLLSVDMDVSRMIRRLGVPFDLTVHDYYAICPQINFLPFRFSHYCGEPDIGDCNTCIANRPASGARDIGLWRAERAWQFYDADRILCPSMDLLERLRRRGVGEHAVYAPHDPVAAEPWPLHLPRLAKGKMRIAVIGTLVDHKGARTVAAVAEAMDTATTELHLIGHTDGPFSAAALKRMKVTGAYEEPELAALIAAVDPHIIWFPMVWPETFSYTLSAAIERGCAIAAGHIGSFPERLAGRPFTWLTDLTTTTKQWLSLFAGIREAIRTAPTKPQAPLRPAVADFYAEHYLRPTRGPRPKRQLGSRRRRIMIIPEIYEPGHPTPCAYIRLLQPLSHPDVIGDAEIRITDPDNALEYEADIIFTQRAALRDTETVASIARHARHIGASLVTDLDDDLLNIPPSHPEAKILRPRAAVVLATLQAANAVWVSTASLADMLGAQFDVTVLENTLDERIWTTRPRPGPLYDEPVRILAMGTASHDEDFQLIRPALERLKREYGGAMSVDILGMTNRALPEGLNRIGPSLHGHRSYPAFVDWLCSVDPPWHIGLAPLLDTPFNRCKSSLKALDYAALGIGVLASDVPVYHGSIADGPAGCLVPNDPRAWYEKLDWLMRDQIERRRLTHGVRSAFLASGTIAAQSAARRRALDDAMPRLRQTESAA